MPLLRIIGSATIKLAPKVIWSLTPKTLRVAIRSRKVVAATRIGIIPKGVAAKKIAAIYGHETVRKIPSNIAKGMIFEAIAISLFDNIKRPILNKVLITLDSKHEFKTEKGTAKAIVSALERGNFRAASGRFAAFATVAPGALPALIEDMIAVRHPKAGKAFRLGLLIL